MNRNFIDKMLLIAIAASLIGAIYIPNISENVRANSNDGLVAYWSFDEGSGSTVMDYSGNNYNGTLYNLDTTSCWVNGFSGKAIEFDGFDGYIKIDNVSGSDEYTYSAWIKSYGTNSLPGSESQTILFHSDDGRPNPGRSNGLFTLFRQNQSIPKLNSVVYSDTSSDELLYDFDFYDGKFHHVSATYSKDNLRLYIDGDLVNNKSISIGNLSTDDYPVYIGNDDQGSAAPGYDMDAPFNGIIDEIRIHNFAQSEDEIKELYLEGTGGLVAYWSFDNSSDVGYDDSGNGHQGTNYGATWISDGISGGALDFDGVDDYVNISDASDFVFANQSLTYTAWVKIADDADVYRYFVYAGATTSAEKLALALCKTRSGNSEFVGKMIMNLRNGDPVAYYAASLDNGETLPKNQWIFLAGVVDYPNSIKLYVNGELQESVDCPDFNMADAQQFQLNIGRAAFGQTSFHNSYIDEVRIYERPLSEEEIQDQYEEHAGVNIFYPIDDAEIAHTSPDTNFGSTNNFAVRNSGSGLGWACDGLVRFNLSSIPEDSTILSATLNAYYFNWDDNNPSGRDLSIYRVASDWDEDTVTWNTQPSYASQSTTNSSVPSSTGVWMEWDVTNDVQDFSDEEATNYGWKITDENYWGSGNIPISFFTTKEHGIFVPYLVINHTVVFEADFYFEMDDDPSHDLKVQFTDASQSPSPITSWWWDFGDHYYSNLQNPVHCYYSPGIYNVTLTITNEDSETSNVTKQVKVPIPFDPFSQWKFEEGSGSEASDSAGDNDGTVNSATWTSGKVDGGLRFDGTDDYVEVTDDDTLSFGDSISDSPFSVAAWIYMDDRDNFIVVGKDEYPDNREFDIRMVGPGYLHFYTLDDSKGMAWIGRKYSQALQNNQWYHVAGTYDGSGSSNGFKIYVNGAQVDDTDYSGGSYIAMENTDSSLYIGRQSSLYADGLIDEVAIWNNVLSAEQIYEMYNQSAIGDKINTSSYWQFEEGNGSVSQDASGDNDGMVNSATWTSGKVEEGLSFDGNNDYVEVTDDDSLSFGNGTSDSAFSVAAWIKMDDRNNFVIVGKDDYPNNREFDIRMVGDGYLHFYTLDDSQGAWIGRKYSEALQNNQWYHVVGTYDGNGGNRGFKIYINGAQVDDMDYSGGSYVAMENTLSNLYIGRQSTLYADGLIDEVGIWDDVLSPEQIYEIYISEYHYN